MDRHIDKESQQTCRENELRACSRERGSVTMVVAILFPVILGCLGMAIDNGRLYSVRRQMQTAADATALAAAHEWRQQNYEGYAEAAMEDAALNGFDADEGVEIDVNVPPEDGPRAGDANFVEVVIREEVPTFFMRVLTDEPAFVETRAVAGLVPADACVYILDPSASNALVAAGDARLTLDGCGIHVNSNSSNAAQTMGGAVVEASSVGIVGDYNGTGFFPTPQTGVYAAPDPLADLPAPTYGGCTYEEQLVITEEQILNPGVYCGGIKIQALGRALLNPGMYVLAGGGLEVQASGEIIGTGVTFYNTDGAAPNRYEPFKFHAASESKLVAPTEGTYKGILFFQDRTISSNLVNTFTGTPDSYFTGVLYFPTTDVLYNGTSSAAAQETMLLARRAEFRGTSDLTLFAEDSDLLPTALAVARVVE